MILIIINVFFVLIPFSSLALILPRGPSTQAICPPSFDWAENETGLAPCLVAAYVQGACGTNNWNVPSLTNGTVYTIPIEAANDCTCSWAAYNLLSACAACQNQPPATWVSAQKNCSGHTSDSYFPANVPIEGGVTIPFWAGTDPSTWPYGQFDMNQAKSLAEEGKPDLGESTPHSSKSPVGPIVGGVIGGVAILAVAVGLAYYLKRRRRILVEAQTSGRPSMHGRSVSDLSHKSLVSMSERAQRFFPGLSSSSRVSISPTIQTHASSEHSLSYFGSAQGSLFSSPGTVSQITPLPTHPEEVIEPFILPPTSPTSILPAKLEAELTRTRTNEDDQSDVLPPPQPTRGRMNPPAYSPYPAPEPPRPSTPSSQVTAAARRAKHGQAHRRIHGSQDTVQSSEASGSRNTNGGSTDVRGLVGFSLPMTIERVVRNGQTQPSMPSLPEPSRSNAAASSSNSIDVTNIA